MPVPVQVLRRYLCSMRLRWRALAVGTALAVVAGAAAVLTVLASDSSPISDRTSFTEPGAIQMMAESRGVLGGDPQTGCLWTLAPDGTRRSLVLAYASGGTDFSTSPPSVRSPGGIIARFGDTVSMGGGYQQSSAVPKCASLGTPFLAWKMTRE